MIDVCYTGFIKMTVKSLKCLIVTFKNILNLFLNIFKYFVLSCFV